MAGERILLVEDNMVNRRMAEFLLKSKGLVVIEAVTGVEAIELARTERPDLIIMDLQLAGMDGFEATRAIKADPLTRHIPVVAMTAYAMSGDRERALAAGCDGYITKPIDTKEFPVTILGYLAGRGETRADGGGGSGR
jgi:two-component system cell cycle response regulator DivK